jgi:hypothetical protein
MRRYKKHFTLTEARAALPALRRRFAAIHRGQQRLAELETALAKQLQASGGDLGGSAVEALMKERDAVQRDLLGIVRMGVVVKDLERGLVDFPHLRDGEEVFLCWELDENDIKSA